MNCTGSEADLSYCKLGGLVELKGNSTCEEGMPVVVSCVPGRAFAPTVSAGFRKAYRVEVRDRAICDGTFSVCSVVWFSDPRLVELSRMQKTVA